MTSFFTLLQLLLVNRDISWSTIHDCQKHHPYCQCYDAMFYDPKSKCAMCPKNTMHGRHGAPSPYPRSPDRGDGQEVEPQSLRGRVLDGLGGHRTRV